MHVALVGAEFEENLAIRYLWGALERAGHQVSQIVFNEASELEHAAAELAASGAELVGMSMVFTVRARQFAALAARARELGYQGHILAGGHFAAFHAEELLAEAVAIDSVALGEGEQIIVALADRFDAKSSVEGLVWRNGEQIVVNGRASSPPDLDSLAWPVRKEPFDSFLGLPITNMLSSRGCSHRCAFCSIAAWHRMCGGPRLRQRSEAAVAEEMAALFEQGVRVFNFHDDNFLPLAKPQCLARLSRLELELRRRKVGRFAFAIKARPDAVDEEVFGVLKRMGLFRVFLGIEAGSAESLRQLGRRQSLSDNIAALEIVNRLDIHACFNLLLLNPSSTLEDMAANVAFLRRRPHNPMNFCRTEVYAGTPLEQRLRQQGRLRGDYWGLGYTIADERAELAFQVMYPSFETRNYGIEGLHHLTMQLDYQHQLLSHFYGTEERLAADVKRLVQKVNLNTCEHLESLIEAIVTKPSASELALTDWLRERVETDNERLSQELFSMLDRIEQQRAARLADTRGWMRTAAAAGLAATLAMSPAACKNKDTHATETVAHPTERAPRTDAAAPSAKKRPTGSAGAPAGSAAPDAGPAKDAEAGAVALLQPQLDREIIPTLARMYRIGRELKIRLWVGPKGQVERAEVTAEKVPVSTRDRIVEVLQRQRIKNQQAHGKRFSLTVTAAQLKAAAPKPRRKPLPRHYSEMLAPRLDGDF